MSLTAAKPVLHSSLMDALQPSLTTLFSAPLVDNQLAISEKQQKAIEKMAKDWATALADAITDSVHSYVMSATITVKGNTNTVMVASAPVAVLPDTGIGTIS